MYALIFMTIFTEEVNHPISLIVYIVVFSIWSFRFEERCCLDILTMNSTNHEQVLQSTQIPSQINFTHLYSASEGVFFFFFWCRATMYAHHLLVLFNDVKPYTKDTKHKQNALL